MFTVLSALFSLFAAQAEAQVIEVDKNYPSYQRVAGIGGNLNSIGSDTLNNLMTLLAEKFHGYYPNVNVQVEGKGSSTAPPALTEGLTQLGPMSRAMTARELESFEKKYGYKPTQVAVAVDALAVYVHRNNPLTGISLVELDAMFSSTRRGGARQNIARWKQVGLNAPLANRAISLYGRNSASGTYDFFKKVALFKGDYRPVVKEQPGSSAVVAGVAGDVAGIGYSGVGYRTADVRILPLSRKRGERSYLPQPSTVLSGKYPLSRLLYIYVAKPPKKPLSLLTATFLDLVLSKQGQQIVVKDGYFPLPYQQAAKLRKRLGL